MGTRGAYGFRLNNIDKVQYNHYDSYPSELGQAVCDFLKSNLDNLDQLKKQVNKLKIVKENSKPTKTIINKVAKILNAEGAQSPDQTHDEEITTNDYYGLLNFTQGHLEKTLDIGTIIDNSGFLNNSLFCEHAYIINLDTNVFEYYKGFQTEPHSLGRYSSFVPQKDRETAYYAVALALEIPFNMIEHIKKLDKYIESALCVS
jgi:hypothetical protein